MISNPGSALFVANFAPDTGYAWDFIQGLYAGISDHLAGHGIRSFVAYPKLDGPAPRLAGSASQAVELPVDLSSRAAVRRVARFIRERDVRVVYLTDRPSRSPGFLPLRRAGARWIVVHDHTSGHRPPPGPVRQVLKQSLNLIPGLCADVVITVSEYVARRQRDVVRFPPARVVCVPNGVPIPELDTSDPFARDELGLDPARPLVACACRAHPVKGVHHLLRAFDLLIREGGLDATPILVYAGDGPQLDELRELRDRLAARDHILLAGYLPDAVRRLRDATVFVAPSVWQDAFPLSVMEPMAFARPVVTSRVGGVPEMVIHGETGLLVEAGDEAALAAGIRRLLTDPEEARRLGRQARERVRTHFSPARQLTHLSYWTEVGFGDVCEGLQAVARTESAPGRGSERPAAPTGDEHAQRRA